MFKNTKRKNVDEHPPAKKVHKADVLAAISEVERRKLKVKEAELAEMEYQYSLGDGS
jgi:hypothetical protein